MPADADRVKAIVSDVFNATPSGYGVYDSEVLAWRDPDAVAAAALQADKWVIKLILLTPNHPDKHNYYVETSITDGGLITGELNGVKVDGKPGEKVPLDTLNIDKKSTLSLVGTSGRYAIDGNYFYFIGTTASYLKPTFTATGSMQAPDGYEYPIACGAASILSPKQGAFATLASHFSTQWLAHQEMIRRGEIPRMIEPYVPK